MELVMGIALAAAFAPSALALVVNVRDCGAKGDGVTDFAVRRFGK